MLATSHSRQAGKWYYATCPCMVHPTHWMGHDQLEERTYRCPDHGSGWRKATLFQRVVLRRVPMTRSFYDQLDPGIRDVVRLLRENFFDTVDSGDGISKPPEHRTLDVPHVFCRVKTPNLLVKSCHRMKEVLRVHGLYAAPSYTLTRQEASNGSSVSEYAQQYGDGFCVEGSYDPESEVAVIAVLGTKKEEPTQR